jgi:hypothetical protein
MPSNFYDHANEEGHAARTMACDAALADLIEYMKQDGVRVAAFDATNSTKARRKVILNTIRTNVVGVKKMFVESVCDQDGLLEENIRKVKLSTPDYRDMDPEEAMADFMQRRAEYIKVYEPVDDSDGSYIKIINSKQFIGTLLTLCETCNSIAQCKHGVSPVSLNIRSKQHSRIPTAQGGSLCHEFAYASPYLLPHATWAIGIQLARKNWRRLWLDSIWSRVCSPVG